MTETNQAPASQISLQIKVIALVLVAAVIMFGGMLWKTEALLLQEKTALINDSAMKQMAPLKRLVQQRLNNEKEALIDFAGIRVGQNPNQHGVNADFGIFDVISLMQVSQADQNLAQSQGQNQKQNQKQNQWSPAWIERNPNVKEDRWPRGHDLTLLKSLSYARLRDGEVVWSRVSDRQGTPVYAIMISVEIQSASNEKAAQKSAERTDALSTASALPDTADQALSNLNQGAKAVLVGFSSVNPLAAVTEDFIGSTNNVYLVDDRGYVASHVNKAYQGALFTEDPLVREIIKGRKSGSTGKFEDLESRPVLGHYERVEHSNLYAVITTPEQILAGMLGPQRQAAVLWGVAILLAVLGFAVLLSWLLARQVGRQVSQQVGQQVSQQVSRQADQAQEASTTGEDEMKSEAPAAPKLVEVPAPMAAPVVAAPLKPQPRVLTEKEKRFADGRRPAVTEPLHGILGHASLVRVKAGDDDVQGHADSISREARRLRDVVERIHDWQDETVASADASAVEERVDLNAAITDALKEREADFITEDVHVIRELRPLPSLVSTSGGTESAQVRLKNAVDRLIDNAIEAMQARPSKHLRIETRFENDRIQLRLTDTGIGMSRDVRERAFDPFFKGFESPARLGLGLSSVAATVKSLGGSHAIESVMGEGSTFTFEFPVSPAERDAFNERDLRTIADSVSGRAKAVETPAPEVEREEPAPEVESEPLASFSDNDGDEDELKIEVIQPALFTSQIREEIVEDEVEDEPVVSQPRGPLMLDELDDDDEMFANIPLSKASSRLTKVGQLAPQKPQAEAPAKSFEVKIRKPRMNGPEKGAE